ncbi:FadR/GntR family transcriptional regulator [Streptomyces sp. NPDC055140]
MPAPAVVHLHASARGPRPSRDAADSGSFPRSVTASGAPPRPSDAPSHKRPVGPRPMRPPVLREGTSEFLPRAINRGLMPGQRRTQDLVEVRTYMEGVSARLAAERSTDADVARLEEHLRHMREAGSGVKAFIDADIAFHLGCATIARNTALSDILHSIRALLQVWMERVSDIEGTVSGTLCEHDAVLKAIRDRDPEAADRAMAEHMRMASARLRESMNPADGEGSPQNS